MLREATVFRASSTFRWLATLVCAFGAIAASATPTPDPHGCPEQLVDFLVGEMFQRAPTTLFAGDSDVVRDAILVGLDSPVVVTRNEERPLGAILAGIPDTVRATSRWSLEHEHKLNRHDTEADSAFVDELLYFPASELETLHTFLRTAATLRYPLDARAIFGRTRTDIAETLPPPLHYAAVRHLTGSANRAVIRALQLLRVRDLAVRRHMGDGAAEPVFDLAFAILQSARWEDWHRHESQLKALLREVVWMAETDRSDVPAAKLVLWMIEPPAESFRTYLATTHSPTPDQLRLPVLFRRLAPFVREPGRVVLADVLDALASRHALQESTRGHAYLYYDYGAGLFQTLGDRSLEALFVRRRDALLRDEPSLPRTLNALRYTPE